MKTDCYGAMNHNPLEKIVVAYSANEPVISSQNPYDGTGVYQLHESLQEEYGLGRTLRKLSYPVRKLFSRLGYLYKAWKEEKQAGKEEREQYFRGKYGS